MSPGTLQVVELFFLLVLVMGIPLLGAIGWDFAMGRFTTHPPGPHH